MVVATKGKGPNTGRGRFVSLLRQPMSTLESVEIGNGVLRMDSTRRMEDTPIGGDELKIGNEIVGHLLDCPLPVDEAWTASRIKAMELNPSRTPFSRRRVVVTNPDDTYRNPYLSR